MKHMAMAFGFLFFFLGVVATPASAEGPPVSVQSGMQYGTSNNESCTIGVVGNDSFGNKVAITAGHCGAVGTIAYTMSNQKIGVFASSRKDWVIGTFEYNKFDYAFIKLDDNVVLADDPTTPPNIKSIVAPPNFPNFSQPVCKFGHSVGTLPQMCGYVTNVTPIEFGSGATTFFGDSGGPVYLANDKTKIAGIVSRPANIPYLGANISQRVDAAVSDATAKGWVGAGFVPVA